MPAVYLTRAIPEIGLGLLRDKGYEIDVSPHNRPLTRDELIAALRAKPYDAVLTLLTDRIDAEIFDAAPSVKIFANYTIGYDNFDVEEGKKRGVFLTNAPGGGAERVAEHTWALILALSCRVVEGDTFMRQGRYTGWDPMLFMGTKLAGKTLGLIGAGRIGAHVARIGSTGFGMRVAYHDVKRSPEIERLGVSYWPTPDEVLKQADIVSLHVPLLPSTHHLISAERLAMMKPTAKLVNTSRGPVIDEQALVQALHKGLNEPGVTGGIAGAGLDVFENEPALAPGLSALPNVVMTPHIASSTKESRDDMARLAVINITSVLDGGQPVNPVYN